MPALFLFLLIPENLRAQAPAAGNNSPTCIGASLQLSSNFILNATYLWLGPNGFSSTQQNPFIQQANMNNAGQYTLTVTVNSQNTVDYTSVQILQTLAPLAGSNSPVCLNGTINLSANNIAGATYSWSGPSGFFSAMRTPSIFNAQSFHGGNYTVTLSKPGCQNGVGTTSVTVTNTSLNLQAGGNSPVCQGGTLTMTSTNLTGASYSWAGPAGFTASGTIATLQNVQPQAAGAYTVTATYSTCSNTSIVQVNVIPTPQAIPSSNSPVCTGQNISLSASFQSNVSYYWMGPNGFSTNIQNPVIQNAQSIHAGVYTLMVVPMGNCPSVSQTIQVTVNPAPTVNAGSNSPVCSGNTLNLTATTVQNANYFWSGPGGYTSNIQNPVISPAQSIHSGAYQLVISNLACGNITRIVQVQVNSPIQFSVGNNGPICAGGSLYLTTNLSPNSGQFYWMGPNGFSSTVLNPVISNAQSIHAGVYTLSASVAGCGMYTSTTTVVINPGNTTNLTIGANSPVCSGQTLFLTATTISGATYFWQGPNGFTSNAQNPVIQQVSTQRAGNYYLTVTIPGCGTISRFVNVQVVPGPVAQPGSNSPVCAGGAINLTTPNLSGLQYLWLGPNGFSSTNPTPFIQNAQSINSGVYTLMVSAPNCGTVSATTTVQVVPAINNTQVFAGSNSPLCTGGTLNLTATSIPGATYLWQGPNGFTSNQQNVTRTNITLQMAGNYYVTISGAGCGTVSRFVTVVINQSPTAQASSNSPICAGQTLNLNTPAVSGASYLWLGPNGFSSNLSNPSRPNSNSGMAGVYTVIVTRQGCGSATSTTTVVVNPGAGTITGGSNSPICAGQTLNLSVTNITGATYTWYGPNGFSSTSRTPSITNATSAASGGYYVIVSVPGCGNVYFQLGVQVNPAPTAQASSNSPLCSGQTLNLSTPISNGATYLWLGPGGFSSNLRTPSIINVNPNQAGAYTLIVSTPGCGNAYSVTNVVINQTSVNVNAGSNSPICTGSNLYLSATSITGGVYNWSGPGGFTAIGQNAVRTNTNGQMSGVYTLTITNVPCGPIVRTVPVTINSTLTLSAGSNSPVCVGQNLVLTAGPVTNTTNQFYWVGPNGFSGVGSTITRSPVQTNFAGVYTVYMNVPGCGTQQQTVSVVVNGFPNVIQAGGNSPVCMGSTLILTGTPVNGGTAIWTGPNGFSANGFQVTRVQATPNMNGTYQYTVNLPGCGMRQAFASVVVNNPANVNAVVAQNPVCAGSSIVLSAFGPPGSSFSWTGPAGFTANQPVTYRLNATNNMAGTYTVQVNVPGCGIITRTINVYVINCRMTSNSELENLINLKVYPNPFMNLIQGEALAGSLAQVQLMDLNGRVIQEANVTEDGTFQLNGENLPAGVYLLIAKTSDGQMIQTKLIKQ
jgi:hypothetical protein